MVRRGQENTPALGSVINHLVLGVRRTFGFAGRLTREFINRFSFLLFALAPFDTGWRDSIEH